MDSVHPMQLGISHFALTSVDCSRSAPVTLPFVRICVSSRWVILRHFKKIKCNVDHCDSFVFCVTSGGSLSDVPTENCLVMVGGFVLDVDKEIVHLPNM